MIKFPTIADAYGWDLAGTDTYTTLVTPSRDMENILISLGGENDALVSLDGGVTNHIYVPAASIIVLDAIKLQEGVAIQGKNASGGSAYAELAVTVW